MTFRKAVSVASRAARANLLPGLLLQSLMLVFFMLYVAHEGTREFLAHVADLKQQTSYGFAFVSYVLSAALLPEILRIGFFQGGKPTRRNLWNFLTAAPAWGAMGVLVDFFYRCQGFWFGTGNDAATVLTKMAVDQFLFSPLLANPLVTGYFLWRDAVHRRTALRKIFHSTFITERVFPVQVAGWIIWIPGVCLIYFMPPDLQLPVAALIQTFWVLVFTLVNRSNP